jgi:CubicO group peptidase (beta-lactamase class C family)
MRLAKIFFFFLLSIVAVIVVFSFSWGVVPEKGRFVTSFSTRKGLEDKFDEIFAENSLSGTVLVSQNSHTRFEKCYGWADPERKILNYPNTQFNIGSCTKQMTGFLVLQLEKEGKLNRAEPLRAVIPELSNTQIGTVTIDQLLQMSGGVPNLMKPLAYISVQLSSKLWTAAEILDEIKDYPLEFEPGARYEYSNLSYVLLGIAVEKVTGQSWEQSLQERIFTPFEMPDTTVSGGQPIENLAKPFVMCPRFVFWGAIVYFPMPQWNYSTLKGAGGVVSTIIDLQHWERGLTKFVEQEPELASRYFGGGGPGNYAYGWQITESQNAPIQFHAGETPGYCALIVRCPSSASSAILLFNSDFVLLKKMEQCSMEALQNRIISILETLESSQ